jgi:hypothetical protein
METKRPRHFPNKLLSFPLGASWSVESVWHRLVSFLRHPKHRREGNELSPDDPGCSRDYLLQVANTQDDLLQEIAELLARTITDLEKLDPEEGRHPCRDAAVLAVDLRIALDEIDGISHRLPSYEKAKRQPNT